MLKENIKNVKLIKKKDFMECVFNTYIDCSIDYLSALIGALMDIKDYKTHKYIPYEDFLNKYKGIIKI